jgi:hypothetical protein
LLTKRYLLFGSAPVLYEVSITFADVERLDIRESLSVDSYVVHVQVKLYNCRGIDRFPLSLISYGLFITLVSFSSPCYIALNLNI